MNLSSYLALRDDMKMHILEECASPTGGAMAIAFVFIFQFSKMGWCVLMLERKQISSARWLDQLFTDHDGHAEN